MKNHLLPFSHTGAFSQFFLDYISRQPALEPFYHRFPSPESFGDQLSEKSAHFTADRRRILHDSLRAQYGALSISAATEHNLASLLSAHTFTVTTGHQLNLFTGPLYFIYKIATVINTCRRLAALHPGKQFVPVYWMASEDHDFEEIRSFNLGNRSYTWQTEQQGAVGRFTLKDLQPLLKEIPGDLTPFKEAYSTCTTLAEAVRHYVNALFGDEGIVVIDGDDARLKSTFSTVMEADILNGTTRSLVEETNNRLSTLGYTPQVFVRDVNFFWLGDGSRERIENHGEKWTVLNGGPTLSADELRAVIRETPERLSPNVILRPLYQETILPNLAYVGGPAENVYWLQLKSVFSHFKVPFPMLMPRNFVMMMDGPMTRLFEKTGISLEELFLPKNDLLNLVTRRYSVHELSLATEKVASTSAFSRIREQAGAIDPTLIKMVEAEQHRRLKGLEIIEKKMLRAERRRQSDRLRQVETLKDNLFPGGGLQERTDNLLLFSQTDPGFIRTILTALDPFEYAFNVLSA